MKRLFCATLGVALVVCLVGESGFAAAEEAGQ